jgi:hypothetical protein
MDLRRNHARADAELGRLYVGEAVVELIVVVIAHGQRFAVTEGGRSRRFDPA